MAPIVTFTAMDTRAEKRAETDWIEKAENLDRTLKPPPARPMRETIAWAVAGMIPGFALGFFLLGDRSVGPLLGVPAILLLPFIGAGLGYFLSPHMRAEREYQRKVAAVHARQQETPEERYQRERVEANWQKTQAEWRQRVYDALVWWSSQGEKLTSDSDYLLALVRQRRGVEHPSYETVLAKYRNQDDPCSTPQRAEQVAIWALANLSDLIAEHIAQESQRTVPGLTKVLRHHHKRDVVLYEELKAYQLNQALEAYRDESPEHLVERLLKEFDAVALAKEKGIKQIQDIAAGIKDPAAKADFTRAATAGIKALLDAWMFARANAVV
jgi:hypothetical protein